MYGYEWCQKLCFTSKKQLMNLNTNNCEYIKDSHLQASLLYVIRPVWRPEFRGIPVHPGDPLFDYNYIDFFTRSPHEFIQAVCISCFQSAEETRGPIKFTISWNDKSCCQKDTNYYSLEWISYYINS